MTKARILADYVAGGTTAAEFDYMDGVTSNVQTQLDAKLALAGGTMTGDLVPTTPLSHRNIIINGAMSVAQRGNGPETDGGYSGFYHTADRMHNFNNCVAMNVTRETTNGVLGTESGNTFNDVFPYSWKYASNDTVSSIPAGDRVYNTYRIEGLDLQHLGKGTANAKSLTLSFWVKSTQTGNHQVNLVDKTNTRQIGATYAVSSAGTWEKKTITFAGDTTGALANSNASALEIEWWLTSGISYTSGAVPTSWEAVAATDSNAGGAANYVGGSGRTWQITGVQLELGSSATPFEHRSYADELARCQRYYEEINSNTSGYAYQVFAMGSVIDATAPQGVLMWHTPKRANATVAFKSTIASYQCISGSNQTLNALTFSAAEVDRCQWYAGSGDSSTVGRACILRSNNSSATGITISSEL